jgi:hypothetical protein
MQFDREPLGRHRRQEDGPGVPTVDEYINNFSAFIMRLP